VRRLGVSAVAALLTLWIGMGSSAAQEEGISATPTFNLSGTTQGAGTFTVGADVLIPLQPDGPGGGSNLRLVPTFQVATTDGVATILTGTSEGVKGATSWQFGGSLTYTQRQPILRIDVVSLDAKADLVARCRQNPLFEARWEQAKRYAISDTKGAEAEPASWTPALADEVARKAVDELSAEQLCPSAIAELVAAERLDKLPLPLTQASFAFLIGKSQLSYLTPGVGGDPAVYSATSASKPHLSAGAAYTQYLPKRHLSFEIPARLDLEYQQQATVARWCTPAGEVARPMSADRDPAQVCSERALGAPSRALTAKAAAYFGVVGPKEDWRASVGPVASVSVESGDNPYQIGVEAPFYVFRKSAGYSGLIRVTPSALLTRDRGGKEDATFVITLALLGDRTLFAGALQ
jgi:hypothetical protein